MGSVAGDEKILIDVTVGGGAERVWDGNVAAALLAAGLHLIGSSSCSNINKHQHNDKVSMQNPPTIPHFQYCLE